MNAPGLTGSRCIPFKNPLMSKDKNWQDWGFNSTGISLRAILHFFFDVCHEIALPDPHLPPQLEIRQASFLMEEVSHMSRRSFKQRAGLLLGEDLEGFLLGFRSVFKELQYLIELRFNRFTRQWLRP